MNIKNALLLAAVTPILISCDCSCTTASCDDGAYFVVEYDNQSIINADEISLKWIHFDSTYVFPDESIFSDESIEYHFTRGTLKSLPDSMTMAIYVNGVEVKRERVLAPWTKFVCNQCSGSSSSCSDDVNISFRDTLVL